MKIHTKMGNRVSVYIDTVDGFARTTFHDKEGNVLLDARAKDEERYIVRAEEYGYKSPHQMSYEHEWCHTLISWLFHGYESATLYRVATGKRGTAPQPDGFEEELVLEFQRFLNSGHRVGLLRIFDWFGLDLDQWGRRTRRALRSITDDTAIYHHWGDGPELIITKQLEENETCNAQ